MTFDLIDAKEVTIEKLLRLFKSAYIKAERHDDTTIVTHINGIKVLLALEDYRITIHILVFSMIKEKYKNQLLNKAMELNIKYRCKFVVCIDDDHDSMMITITSHELRFNCGLNFAQLVDDIHFLIKAHEVCMHEFLEYMNQKNILVA